jgi:hypothetical protein
LLAILIIIYNKTSPAALAWLCLNIWTLCFGFFLGDAKQNINMLIIDKIVAFLSHVCCITAIILLDWDNQEWCGRKEQEIIVLYQLKE